jgi:hypothetical protein
MIIYKKMNDTILHTQNYYAAIDPEHYYKTTSGTALDGKATRAKKHKDVYLSDLLNNKDCFVSFSAYRDTDNASADVKISGTDFKTGIVRSYNPETNLLAIECVKKRPSRISTLFKRTNKMRYVEPGLITVSSVSRFCLLRRVRSQTARASPKGVSPKGVSPKGATPRFSSKGGKRGKRGKRRTQKR